MSKSYQYITDFAKDTFIIFLREYFSNHDRWTYDEDENKTKIQICEDFTFNLEVVNFRPAITVARGHIRFGQATIGQSRGIDFTTEKRIYTDLVTCDIILKCISRNGLEAERLASTVSSAIHMTRDAIKKEYKIMSLNSIDLGTEQIYKADSSPDIVFVPVVVRFQKQVTWAITPKAPVLGDITAKVAANKRI